MYTFNSKVGLLISISLTLLSAFASARTSGTHPEIKYREVPSAIQQLYTKNEPELGDVGSCATAFDSLSDDDKMVFTCSIFIKILAEGERRAIKRCEELKEPRGIKAPCRIISK